MQRVRTLPRHNWKDIAESNGFHFHHVNGDLYWDESSYYSFSLQEIENKLEDPAQEIHNLCIDLVSEACADSEILDKLRIPSKYWDFIANSWKAGDQSIYGRFDFSYNGKDDAKLLEYNADTPTALYEASYFQWLWLGDCIKNCILPKDADQFNSIQEKLIDVFVDVHESWEEEDGHEIKDTLYFACMKGSEEDRATVEYLQDCAMQAGVATDFIYMEDIGVVKDGDKVQLVDLDDKPIFRLFKLYPWEYIWEDEFKYDVIYSQTQYFEPPWKMILSNKGILPLLWERHRNHPNLLPAGFGANIPPETSQVTKYVTKPLFSREGSNITLYEHSPRDKSYKVFKNTLLSTQDGGYGREGYIWQAYSPLPDFDGNYPVCGLWIVNGISCGLGIREDASPITTDTSRFVPHTIIG